MEETRLSPGPRRASRGTAEGGLSTSTDIMVGGKVVGVVEVMGSTPNTKRKSFEKEKREKKKKRTSQMAVTKQQKQPGSNDMQ